MAGIPRYREKSLGE